ncbi:signal peptidase I [Lacticaseibacillus porcinae]|uniref:signal peptidase I n=1 Tax=Lacticaseibacillus porcinae TaxID=1123687 RepID=UPI000F7B9869|nr:signal peptidase I [Lacticaseibacillus porcinae]
MKKIPWFVQLLLIMVVAFAGARLLMTQVLSNDTVSGDSMQPTLNDKNRLISVRHHSIKRNDIVVLDAPDVAGELYIKRVIGMPGDTVAVKNEKLYVNGKYTPQPYLKSSFMASEITAWGKAYSKDTTGVQFTPDFNLKTNKATHSARVPKGEYFVMGDNRFVSHDGRAFGFIKKSSIQSVVVWRYWPLNQMKTY